jgi:hypothetical protein
VLNWIFFLVQFLYVFNLSFLPWQLQQTNKISDEKYEYTCISKSFLFAKCGNSVPQRSKWNLVIKIDILVIFSINRNISAIINNNNSYPEHDRNGRDDATVFHVVILSRSPVPLTADINHFKGWPRARTHTDTCTHTQTHTHKTE